MPRPPTNDQRTRPRGGPGARARDGIREAAPFPRRGRADGPVHLELDAAQPLGPDQPNVATPAPVGGGSWGPKGAGSTFLAPGTLPQIRRLESASTVPRREAKVKKH